MLPTQTATILSLCCIFIQKHSWSKCKHFTVSNSKHFTVSFSQTVIFLSPCTSHQHLCPKPLVNTTAQNLTPMWLYACIVHKDKMRKNTWHSPVVLCTSTKAFDNMLVDSATFLLITRNASSWCYSLQKFSFCQHIPKALFSVYTDGHLASKWYHLTHQQQQKNSNNKKWGSGDSKPIFLLAHFHTSTENSTDHEKNLGQLTSWDICDLQSGQAFHSILNKKIHRTPVIPGTETGCDLESLKSQTLHMWEQTAGHWPGMWKILQQLEIKGKEKPLQLPWQTPLTMTDPTESLNKIFLNTTASLKMASEMLIMTLTEKHNVAQDFEQIWWNWHQVLQGQGRYLKGRCDYGHWTSKDYQRIPFHEQKAKSFPANLKPNCKWMNCNQKHSTHELQKKKELLTYTALLMLKIKRLNATHCQPRRIHTQSITNPHPDTQSNNGEHFSSLQCMYRCIYIIYNVCTGIFAASNSTQEILSPWSLHGTSLLNTLSPTGRHDQTEDWGFYLKCTTDFHA